MSSVPPVNNKRRVFEKARIQKLKSWHESAKKIAKAEIEFRDNVDDAYTDWIMDETIRSEVIKKDS